ncbi:DUF445 domain-containing protein [Pseudoalteromonas sp. MMG010]|uniref:DUF445 domain-containing protein n=1 Tax=Pseudoalteromonas sp. MMG010 TaxID=2822685 RepID=UPI001B3A2AF5|nr:DUF445 domain-containing protein [Pseudoalteromonas sp. MMG010]MBQ4832513.1 DUF445 domain-containing protein [Pseudoalteromonas sp. MMG010]
MNKSLITNTLATIFVVFGYLTAQSVILSIGLFALSGAVTNLIAIHMLFERVPFIYGSGVIALKFESFKAAIRNLIITEFFSQQKIANLLKTVKPNIDFSEIIAGVDLNPAFDNLLQVIEQSQFGSMLGMFGGTEAIEPMREKFIEKMQLSLSQISETEEFSDLVSTTLMGNNSHEQLYDTVIKLVDDRLEELTPKMVKEIIQTLIKEHLGWLVVWGGVFGGLFGLIAAII